MTAVGETDLATNFLDFCQTLSSQGSAFNFPLIMGSNLSFSLDSGHKGVGLGHPGQDSTQEEAQPIHPQEECQAQGSVPEQEAEPCTFISCKASPVSS